MVLNLPKGAKKKILALVYKNNFTAPYSFNFSDDLKVSIEVAGIYYKVVVLNRNNLNERNVIAYV